jgi:hypothetical protein
MPEDHEAPPLAGQAPAPARPLPEVADAALAAVGGVYPPVEVDEIDTDELFRPVAGVVEAALAPATAAVEDGGAPPARERALAELDARLEEILRRTGETEARVAAQLARLG